MEKNPFAMTKEELTGEWEKIKNELENKKEAAENGCCSALTSQEEEYLALAIYWTTKAENCNLQPQNRRVGFLSIYLL